MENETKNAVEEIKEKTRLYEEKTGFLGLEGLARDYINCKIEMLKEHIDEDHIRNDWTVQVDHEVVDRVNADYQRVQKLPETYKGIKQIADGLYQELKELLKV